MRNIFNFIVTGVIFALGGQFFGEYINIQDGKTLLIATLMMFVLGWIFSVLVGFSALLIPVGIGCITILPLIIMAFVLTPIKLLILSNYLDGFVINGFWTYIILSVVLGMFTIGSKNNN